MPLSPLRPWHRDTAVRLGLLTALLVAAFDVVSRVQLTGGYTLGAFVTAMTSTPRRTAGVGGVAVVLAVLGGLWHHNIGSREWLVRAVICLLLAAFAVTSSTIRVRREASLRRLTVIAETAQRAVLRTTPTAVGSVGFASRYVSASEEASLGGDLYEIAATPFGVRVIVGDVRGKGLPAVQTAASVLGAFRQAAFSEPDPAALARAVDDVVSRLIDDEEFVTAIFAEFREDRVTLANCGHHPPLLVSEGRLETLDTGEPTTPLGLGPRPQLVEHPWPVPARLLLYTDGLVEARNRRGEFFPLEDETTEVLSGRPLGESLDAVIERLRAFAGARIGDDVALVLAENRAS